jgi:hypothetical protein
LEYSNAMFSIDGHAERSRFFWWCILQTILKIKKSSFRPRRACHDCCQCAKCEMTTWRKLWIGKGVLWLDQFENSIWTQIH